jgi:epoxide hydrolase
MGDADGSPRLQALRRTGWHWGSAITTAIGAQDSAHCVCIHITLAMSARPNVESQPTAEEARTPRGMKYYADQDTGY